METLDFVVIGAGIAGLAAAKTHHQLNPDHSLAVLDAYSSVGGVWAEHRLYPGLKSNNMVGTYEYPDFPMDPETFGVQPGQHIPGQVMHKYLTRYAEHFKIIDKIRHNTKVLSAEHREDVPEGGWILTFKTGNGVESKLIARKLVVATGLTSEAFLPDFAGQDTFGAPLFHTKDFLQHADTLETAKSVTVFGGTKSAWDASYAFGSKGIPVNWVIRESGHGPAWMAPPYVTPLKKWLEKLVHTRMLTWFSPCVWGAADGYSGIRDFWHGTAIGRAITNTFWSILGNDVLTLNKYDSHPELKKLKPWSQAMFTGSSLSILNYPTDFFELVKNGTVKVHIADLSHLSNHTVHLADEKSTSFETDALICATGWKHVTPLKFLPEGIETELGVPHATAAGTGTPQDKEPLFKPDAVAKVDADILARFPRLKDQPVQNAHMKPLLNSGALSTTDAVTQHSSLTPYTFYRFIIPPSERFLKTRDIAFAGVMMNITVAMIAHVQGLWIDAYFSDKLPSSIVPPAQALTNGEYGAVSPQSDEQAKSLDELRYETLLHSRFGKWRYPAGHGAQFPDFVFDALPYVDLLVGDLGLKVHRKGGWLAEASAPYGPEDYRDLVDEWKAKAGQ